MFNRALLLNIGFKEALKFDQYECFIFHDVDLIPQNDRNTYSCPSSPRHLSVAVDTLHYRQVDKRDFLEFLFLKELKGLCNDIFVNSVTSKLVLK